MHAPLKLASSGQNSHEFIHELSILVKMAFTHEKRARNILLPLKTEHAESVQNRSINLF